MSGPEPIDAVGGIPTSIIAPYGSVPGNLLSYSAPAMMDPVFSGGVDWNETSQADLLLGYLQEIWQRTAARHYGSPHGNPIKQVGTAVVDAGADELVTVSVDFGADPRWPGFGPNSDVFCNFGWAYFSMGDFALPPVRVQNAVQMLVAPQPGCTSCTITPRYDDAIYRTTAVGKSADNSILSKAGKAISPATNDFSGVGANTGLPAFTTVSNGDFISVPTLNPTNLIQTNGENLPWLFDFIHLIGSGPKTALTFSYLVEIWQRTVATWRGASQLPLAIPTGFSDITSDVNYVASFDLTAFEGVPPAWAKFGNSGRYKVGRVTFEQAFGFEETQFITQLKSRVVPLHGPAQGFRIWLEPWVVPSLVINRVPNISVGINTPNGNIRLTDGTTDGLVWGT